MHDLSSCLLEGYGVLPSSPVNFRFSNLGTSFGILHWEPPATLGETVKDYIVSYQVSNFHPNLVSYFLSNLLSYSSFLFLPNLLSYSIPKQCHIFSS